MHPPCVYMARAGKTSHFHATLTVMESLLYYMHLIVMPNRFDRTHYFVFLWRGSPHCTETVLFRSFYTTPHTHTSTLGRISLDEWSARRRGRYLHSKHTIWALMPSARLESAIAAIKRPQTYSLDLTATGVDRTYYNDTASHSGMFFFSLVLIFRTGHTTPNELCDILVDSK